MSQLSDETHKRVRKNRPPAFADFMDEVYVAMPENEKKWLPKDIGGYVNALIGFAVKRLPEFGESIARMIAGVYSQSPQGERFVLDPDRCNEITQSILFLDRDGYVVTVKNPDLKRVETDRDGIGVLVMASYQSYEVLTGPLSGQRFDAHSRPLPAEPTFIPGAAQGVAGSPSSPTESAAQPGNNLRVFLCHASEDKEAVRSLYRRLRESGFVPWLDEEELLPGQDWDYEIRKAVRKVHVVLVCLSNRSEKRGYVQKEIVRALDVADEQPEGTIFLIPVKLEPCRVPDRLAKWQWVDLSSQTGYTRLESALRLAARNVSESGSVGSRGDELADG